MQRVDGVLRPRDGTELEVDVPLADLFDVDVNDGTELAAFLFGVVLDLLRPIRFGFP